VAWAFLTAQWRNLVLVNYAVPEELLRHRLPPGLELDLYEGQPCASLVGFQFLQTKVLGIPWPGFRNFPEWNLRFYVRRGQQRGVCFVREFVPQRFVAWMARTTYNEPYESVAMTMNVTESAERIQANYTVEKGGREHRLSAIAHNQPTLMPNTSVEHFFKEHEWGFGRSRGGRLLTYRVSHPVWNTYPIVDCGVDVDWGLLYGPEWRVMNGVEPRSVVLAAGSNVAVYPHD
jgi:hypothetical protein